MVEIIPDNVQVLAAMEDIRGHKTPVPFMKEKSFRRLHNFFSTYIRGGVLTEQGKENIDQSAMFLPHLLKHTSDEYDMSRVVPEKTRNLWRVTREYIFGHQKRPQMMRRLQRTFQRAGLVAEGGKVTTKTFQIVNALFDRVVIQNKKDRENIIFLKRSDNRSLLRSWLDSITKRPENENLISPEFARLLASQE